MDHLRYINNLCNYQSYLKSFSYLKKFVAKYLFQIKMPIKTVKQVYLYFCQKADTTLTYETYAYSRK